MGKFQIKDKTDTSISAYTKAQLPSLKNPKREKEPCAICAYEETFLIGDDSYGDMSGGYDDCEYLCPSWGIPNALGGGGEEIKEKFSKTQMQMA